LLSSHPNIEKMYEFSTISTVKVSDEASWDNQLFLTFDIDWANDEVLNDAIDLVDQAGVAATWFVTNKTPVLERLRENKKFELGIHPNFNFLLQGKHDVGQTAKDVVQRCLKIVPGAKTVRSHSMTQSSGLIEIFKQCGLTHDVNHFVPQHTGIELKPWLIWNNLVRIPYSWEDDVHILYGSIGIPQKSPYDIATDTIGRGLKVFDFHPIHVFLNTESLDRYEQTRPLHQNPKELIKHRYQGYGTRSRLIELLDLCRQV
jgi:hypothetical protein